MSSKNTFIGDTIMPSELMDRIGAYWDENKHNAHKGASGNLYTKESMDLDISVDDFSEPWGDYRKHLQVCLDNYFKEYPESDTLQNTFNIHENYNLQWYAKGGGFKSWHLENAGNLASIHRHLVFMTYLNDVLDKGETEWYHQNLKVQPKKGLTVIWPADWTFVHRGIPSETETKYIATGWYSYD